MVLPRCSSFFLVVLILFSSCSLICLADDANNDVNFFHNLYDTIESTLVPHYDHGVASPTQVILFETPGLAVNRDLFDANTWSSNNYAAQQPDAVAAQFVDRAPFYSSSLFIDSGSTISGLWGSMLYQFVVPITDDPIADAKLMDARSALANGTLQNAFSAASLDYEQSYNDFVNFRTNCLAKQNTAGICSAQAVLYRERLLRKWFTLEVARRDLSSAEARIIAVQTTDLKVTFAEALYLYSSNERIDMGTAGIGQNFFQTYLSPSNFYLWFAPSGAIDYEVLVGKSVTVDLEGTATTAPTKGAFSNANATNSDYTPTSSILTSGLDTYTYTNAAGASVTRVIRIIARDVIGGANSFTPVSASSITPSADVKSFSSNFDAPLIAAGASSGIRILGMSNTNAASVREALTGSGSVFSMSCEVTRVSITRPWLDTSILSLYPVAIRGAAAGSWSDGAITPAQSGAAYKFKLLPVSFIVARNIDLTFTLTSTVSEAQTAAESFASSVTVSYGVVFTGSATSSFNSATRDYQETSHTTATGIHIRGPQVIGWICNPIPSFPTSDEAGVRNWEATQLARETAVTDVAAAATSSGLLPSADPPVADTIVVDNSTM